MERVTENRFRKVCILMVSMFFLTVLFSGCGTEVTADLSTYEQQEIIITGLDENSFSVTPAQLAQMECQKKSITSANGKKQVSATAVGPLFSTFLEGYDEKTENFTSITFVASDGYVREFDAQFFTTHPDAYLSLANDDQPLSEDEQPMRLVVDGATPDNWVKGVVEIRFER